MSRLALVVLALSLASASLEKSARAHSEGEDDAEGTPGATDASSQAKAAKPAGARASDKRRRKSKVAGFAVRDADLRSAPPPPPSAGSTRAAPVCRAAEDALRHSVSSHAPRTPRQ